MERLTYNLLVVRRNIVIRLVILALIYSKPFLIIDESIIYVF